VNYFDAKKKPELKNLIKGWGAQRGICYGFEYLGKIEFIFEPAFVCQSRVGGRGLIFQTGGKIFIVNIL
jgi:hypothetical protein